MFFNAQISTPAAASLISLLPQGHLPYNCDVCFLRLQALVRAIESTWYHT
jgi:hypothetical protein